MIRGTEIEKYKQYNMRNKWKKRIIKREKGNS